MGNYASCIAGGMREKQKTIQLVSSDGTVQILQKPLRADQIIQEFPDHLVCHSHSFYIGQKTRALSPIDQLEIGNTYFLLPLHFFQSELTLVLLASLISPPSLKSPSSPTGGVLASLRSIERASALCQPFEIEKSSNSGGPHIRVSVEFVTKLMEDGRLNVDERRHGGCSDSADDKRRLCNTPELQKDYEQLVTSRGQCWRPKLETIKEKEKKGNCHKLIFKIKRLSLKRS